MAFLRSKYIPIDFNRLSYTYKKYQRPKLRCAVLEQSSQSAVFKLCTIYDSHFSVSQLTTFLKLIKPQLKRSGPKAKMEVLCYPDTILTKKAKDIRMGRGKGLPDRQTARNSNGRPILQFRGLTLLRMGQIFRAVKSKIPGAVALSKHGQW